MQNDRQKQNDLWIKQSLGNASNWEELDENDRNSLRKTMALYILFAIILVSCITFLSLTILQHGAKATLVTSSLTIIGAVFPAMGKVTSESIEYFESTNQKLHAVVPEKLRTLDHGRPWSDDQFASTRLSSNRDMSR